MRLFFSTLLILILTLMLAVAPHASLDDVDNGPGLEPDGAPRIPAPPPTLFHR